jgi:hypothetical protein
MPGEFFEALTIGLFEVEDGFRPVPVGSRGMSGDGFMEGLARLHEDVG